MTMSQSCKRLKGRIFQIEGTPDAKVLRAPRVEVRNHRRYCGPCGYSTIQMKRVQDKLRNEGKDHLWGPDE